MGTSYRGGCTEKGVSPRTSEISKGRSAGGKTVRGLGCRLDTAQIGTAAV